MEWKNVIGPSGEDYWLPDIAKAVCHRLANTGPLFSEHCPEEMGQSVLRQLSERRETTGGLRLSASGGCQRALAYGYHHTIENGLGIDAGSKIAFTIGDITEAFLVAAIKEVFAMWGQHNGSVYCTGKDQAEVYLGVALGGDRVAKVAGHPDGFMSFESTMGVIHDVVLEVKSMSDYAFKRFRDNGLSSDDSYYWQVQAYMASSDKKMAYLISYGKATTAKEAYIDDNGDWWPASPIHGQWIFRDDEVIEQIKDKFRAVIQSASPDDIERPYGPNKKGMLAFPCDYCRYYKTCFPGSEEGAKESKWLQKSTKIKVYVQEVNND